MNTDQIHRAAMMGSVIALAASVSTSTFAGDAPPFVADQPSTATTESSISATIQFFIPALDRALERKVPRRLASFNDRGSSCWHRRILGRMVNIDCAYSGYVERKGPISLRADNGKLAAATPLFGTVSGQGIGRFARLLHGSGEAELMVYATSRPYLRSDWSVALDMSEGFRWREPPTLQILGFRIDLTRYIEPRVREQVARIRSDAAQSVAAMDIRGKAEAVWQRAFTPVKIVDTPAIWLTMTPKAVAFSGIRARGDVLEGSIEISGTTATIIGTQPAAPTPTPLPAPNRDVANPGRFAVIIPVDISYDQIRQKIQEIISARTQAGEPSVQDVSVYRSSGKIVAGLHLKTDADPKNGAWIYVSATPQIDADSQTMQLTNLALVADPSAADSTSLPESLREPLLQDLQQQVRIAFQDKWQAILASANTRLSRPLADGFRSEGSLTSAGLSNVSLLPEGIRINLRASGDLKISYGL